MSPRAGRWRAPTCLLAALSILLGPTLARAENAILLWGNYYLERSSRVISPMVGVAMDLPQDTQIELSYLVDNITSASGTFAPPTESGLPPSEPFQEFRQELRVDLARKLTDIFSLGVNARYSFEPDYTSLTYGLSGAATLFEENTTVSVTAQRQDDGIHCRGNNVEDTLETWRLAATVSQVILPQLTAGLTFETDLLEGYTENCYRNENHPPTRERFALGGQLAYRFRRTRTTVRGGYRYYWDDWRIEAHTLTLEVFQRISPNLEIIPQLRFHAQSRVNFRDFIDRDGITYVTEDPKLFALGTTGVGLRVVWRLGFLAGGPLDALAGATVHPRYIFYAQRNHLELNPVRILDPQPGDRTRYGDAHIAQLGITIPY